MQAAYPRKDGEMAFNEADERCVMDETLITIFTWRNLHTFVYENE